MASVIPLCSLLTSLHRGVLHTVYIKTKKTNKQTDCEMSGSSISAAGHFHLMEEAIASGSCHGAVPLAITSHQGCCRCSLSKGSPHLHKERSRMLGVSHCRGAPQNWGKTLVPLHAPSWERAASLTCRTHSIAADRTGVTDKSLVPWLCQRCLAHQRC